ncbi:hypothetical protein WA026_021935 [Henosepilachna vigintioctopunctata]|uniref:Gamma-soluble NSF attachment protein n=1 Tax=Henosepilachna vigintioctopunctata TaxID=420089 RepID=A0AAW1VIE8_9CUCU
MMNNQKKVDEGLEYVKNAEKSLKTSFMKWRPDYESAAEQYNKAATCFRNAKSFDQCRDALLKAADCHKQNRAIFYAAKALDQAILVSKELGDLRNVGELANRAANMFQSHGSAESATSTLDKAGKILEAQYPEDALKLFQRAADISQDQDSVRQSAEFMSKVARIHVKLKEYELAADAIRRELGLREQSESYQAAGRLAVALVLVHIARGDIVAAERAFKEWGNYCEAPEVQCLEMLLQAYDEEDPEAAKAALSNPFIKHMDVEYTILARDLPLPEQTLPVINPVVAATSVGGGSVDASSSKADADSGQGNEEDFEEGGLC